MATLLEYENQIYLDMFNNDALLVMAEGLGIERIFLNFLRLYSDPTHLVMVLNLHEAEEKYFLDRLRQSKQNDPELPIQLPTKITNETHTINERVQAYLKGGCFFATSRILAVDMLTDRIPIDLISGILVYKAHKVIDTCQETFILRMFRQNNKKGFIKAFSDKPIYFTKSFCQVDRVMKNLFVKSLFIYPRFHVSIESELSKYKPEVYEVHVSLSENTNRTQMALFDIINVLLQELKGCCSYIDPDYLGMEMVISKPFDKIVRSQLEPVWNQLGSKPKQLISDIKILRLLLYYLIQYDCITFYKMLNCLKMHEREMGRSSGWMFLDAANDLFANARLRVCGDPKKGINKNDLSKKYIYTKDNKEMINRVIKESPKLETLNEILEEILTDFNDEENDQGKLNILLVANDDRTCYQIKHFLNGILKRKFKNSELEFSITTNTNLDVMDNENDDDLTDLILKPADLAISGDHRRAAKPSNKRKLEDTDEPNEAGDKKKSDAVSSKEDAGKGAKGGKGKGRGKKDTKQTLLKSATAIEKPQEEDKKKYDFSCKTNLFLNSYDGDAEQKISLIRVLHEVNPRYVILYDSELWFVRQLELFKSLNFKFSMRIYFLMYKNSYEEQKYLTSIRSEKEAFEILIKEKAKIIIPNEQDGKSDVDPNKERLTINAQMNSRKGNLLNQETENTQPKIIVDMREFRSELPSILHKRGFKIEPVTLEVGDYVLTPNICVERKSINDLIESLSNGRLYNQCTAMTRYYKTPILLIEFDHKKPFLLNSMQSLSTNEINNQHTLSKLVLLTIHFPNLRILWCSSPNETAEIFEELKANTDQPNSEAAQAIKLDQLGLTSDTGAKFNPILSELLLKVPGINSKNIKDIMSKVHSLIELCEIEEKELHAIIENGKNAKAILEFLHKKKSAVNPLYALTFGSSKSSAAAAGTIAEEEEYINNLNINFEDFENVNLK